MCWKKKNSKIAIVLVKTSVCVTGNSSVSVLNNNKWKGTFERPFMRSQVEA